MASIGRPLFLLFIVIHAASAFLPEMEPGVPLTFFRDQEKLRSMTRRLMMNCVNMGFQAPNVPQNMSQQMDDGKARALPDGQNLLSDFLTNVASLPREPQDTTSEQQGTVPSGPLAPQYLNQTRWNCSNLLAMVKMTSDSSEAHICMMRAFLAPLSWNVLMGGGDMTPEDYESMMWAAEPLLQDMPPSDMSLPRTVDRSKMKRMMRTLRKAFGSLSERQRRQVRDWIRQQVPQNYYNCTLKPKSKLGLQTEGGSSERCPRKLMWLNTEVMEMMGPYLSRLRLMELDAAPDDKLCEFFKSKNFHSSFQSVAGMNPVLARRFLNRLKKCIKPPEKFPLQVERLGTLSCYYKDDLPEDVTLQTRLLAQLSNCDNTGAQKLKKLLVKKLMASNPRPSSELLSNLGPEVSMLSSDQLVSYQAADLKEALKKLGRHVKWKLLQGKKFVKKLLQEKPNLSVEDLESLGPAVRAVSIARLKKLQAKEMLGTGSLKNIMEKMSKGQNKALMEGLRQNVTASDLIKKLPGSLLSTLPLQVLQDADLTSLDQVEGKAWSQAQSAFLLRKLIKNKLKPRDIRRLGSAIQGLTCRMLKRTADVDYSEMADALTETPQWLSKTQINCAARELFATLESERPDYFKSITEEELEDVPTLMLIHLQADEIRDLPATVCPTYLTKMSTANLSSLCVISASRPALTERAIRCLADGRNMSELAGEEVLDLGQLLCEVPPRQLRLLSAEALNSSLQAMATCSYIPRLHHLPLLSLLKQTYGNVSDWSQETMESFSPLLLLDDSEIQSLRSRPWLKVVLSDLTDSLLQSSSLIEGLLALKQKLFSLTTQPEGTRRRRADTSTVPTVQLIEELAGGNAFWSPQQLSSMSAETFRATAETLGSITDYNTQQLDALQGKAVEAFGPVARLNESMVIQLGCVNQGFSNPELQALPMTLEMLEELSHCGWLQAQREAIWMGFSGRSTLTADALGAAEIVTLNQFICGLSSEDIGKLQQDAFRDAVSSVGAMACPLSVTKEFKKLAVTAFGAPSQWSEADVSTLGNIVAGLDAEELSSLGPAVLPFLSQDSIPLIPGHIFASMSITQLKALGPDNTAMVSPAQKAALSPEQATALLETLTGSRAEVTSVQTSIATTPLSGAPSLTIEGIATFAKPFLFLFLGLLLL